MHTVEDELLKIIEQLELCGYECQGGPLEMNTVFIRLKELAQAEKAGQLVILPCKIGDTIYYINPERTCIVQIRVQGLSISPTGRIVLHFGGCPPEYAWGDGCGKDWFLTREEAEAALGKKNKT